MATYTRLALTNRSGQHCFRATVVDSLPANYTLVNKREAENGELVQITLTAGGAVVVDDLIIHRNGRTGSRDTSKDTVVMQINELGRIPDDLQVHFQTFELLPEGFVRT